MFTSMESEIQIIFPFNSLQWLESLGKKKKEKKEEFDNWAQIEEPPH